MPKDATSRACHHVQDYFSNYPAVGSLPCQQACPGMQPTPDAAGQKGEELKQMLNNIEVSGVKQGSRNSGKLCIRPPRLQQPHQEGHPPANCINCIYYHLLNGRMARPCPVFAAPFLSFMASPVGLKRSPQSSLAVQPLPPSGTKTLDQKWKGVENAKRQRPSGHC